ncbi:hypothetical protein AAFF_G00085470 [Aldrovandia affinis]|uniref:Uncharacterized protein n=1 Tax=Aldrovandia affinis TaxID=143900 RepID=A0AAD7RX23_9TELE|nr:hypothetical protein AAFF_G00085470 [Aldrovandia affinis]
MVALDELTLRHMAQDCTSVKTQLLKLRRLLQMEDGGVVQDELLSGVLSPESSDDTSASLQVEELMGEVQELRGELRRKEKTIAQLTRQVSAPVHAMRCQCQQRAPLGRGERHTQHDKATQTPWRGHAPQILQPSSSWLREPCPPQRLINSGPSGAPCDPAPVAPGDGRPRGRPRSLPRSAAGGQRESGAAEQLSPLLAHLKVDGPRGAPAEKMAAVLGVPRRRAASCRRPASAERPALADDCPPRLPQTPASRVGAPVPALVPALVPPLGGAVATGGRGVGGREEA